MSRLNIWASCLLVGVAVGTANGGGFDFEFTAPGGVIPAIDPNRNNEGISIFPLTMSPSPSFIETLELQLTGLTHTNPEDLDIYLIDPFGEALEVMTDKGDGFAVVGLTLIFNDLGGKLPGEGVDFPIDPPQPRIYRPEDPLGFAKYHGQSGGTDAWILLVIDDSPDDRGSLESFTLRGTVPEPASLSLLALGALAAIRRSRRGA